MGFPTVRPRRLREREGIRNLVKEHHLRVQDLVYPLFVTHGEGVKSPVPSMPGVCHFSQDTVLEEIEEVQSLKIPAVILFGIPPYKDEKATSAYAQYGVVQETIRAIKDRFPDLIVITDACLCQYMSTGHCGVVEGDRILNDPTLELLSRVALSHARAGADMVAPSDMMDGRIGAIRRELDREGFSHIPIMSYTAKYASSFYGPFRDAAHSAPQFGDRRSYQMDPANVREAIKEACLDLEEGADILMVKPALAFMDVIARVKEATTCPVAAYNVSGEYSMVKAAAQQGWLEERAVVLELLTGLKRAGADIIITYFAKEAARWLREEQGGIL